MNGQRSILVTGAGGFVGAATVRAALAAGHRVMALVRKPGAARLAGLSGDLSVNAADLADTAAISALLADLRPEIVIHSAWEGVSGGKRAGDVQFDNIRTTLSLVDAAIASGLQKFVGIGSQAEYGRFDRRISEDDLPQPTMLYGAAKFAALHLTRQRTREAGVDFAWLRLFAAYGPGDNPNWLIPSVTASLVRGVAPKCSAGTQKWDYLHIDDAAAGILAAAVTPSATGVFNLASGEPVQVRGIVEHLRDLAAPGLPLSFGDIAFGPDQIMHLEGDNSRLRAMTGWSPQIALMDGLAAMVAAARHAA
ncbi:MAG: NAD(P)-dependent oxidoreductase [Sphingomonadales bacterium]|nr:NAD(P)-dependent oxidoreductase [Sphingomonadales bacterium]